MFILRPTSKPCGKCKRCCQGYLTGEAYGVKFDVDNPCKFLNTSGCSIYPNRPHVCKTFECRWKTSVAWPDWLRPDQSNVIFVERIYDGDMYIRGINKDQPVKEEVFAWAHDWAEKTKLTIVIPRECIGFKIPINGERYSMSVYGPNQKIRDHFASMYEIVE